MYVRGGNLDVLNIESYFVFFNLTNTAEEMSQRMLEECDVVMSRSVSVQCSSKKKKRRGLKTVR